MNLLLLQPGFARLDLFQDCPDFGLKEVVGNETLPWKERIGLFHRFRSQPPQLLVVTARQNSAFSNRTGWSGGLAGLVRAHWKYPSDLLILALFAKSVRQNIPIALVNRSDDGRLPPGSDWFYRRCHACFVRELHPLPEIALRDLFTPSGGNPQSNRRARRILSWFDPGCPTHRDISKLRPISLGVADERVGDFFGTTEKKWDLFFAGDLHEKGFRGRLVQELQALAGKQNWKILLRERMPQGEYRECLEASRLCLSPPGMGWDCWRHYEAMLAGAIPVMPYPTILQHQPAIEGRHCFYFAPEPGGLTRCLEKALAAPDRLPVMASAGREHVRKHHTYSQLREYVVQETLDAHARLKR